MEEANPAQSIENENFDAIEKAVRETERGRWFLDEFARRNRQSNTEMLLDSISKLEEAVARAKSSPGSDTMRDQLATLVTEIDTLNADLTLTPETKTGYASGLGALTARSAKLLYDLAISADTVRDLSLQLKMMSVPDQLIDQLDEETSKIIAGASEEMRLIRRFEALIEIQNFVRRRIEQIAGITTPPKGGEFLMSDPALLPRAAANDAVPALVMFESEAESAQSA